MVAWFEIPVHDMDRAKLFYEKVFKVEISLQNIGGVIMAFFPSVAEASGAMGSLMKYESYIPSQEGKFFKIKLKFHRMLDIWEFSWTRKEIE